MLQVSALKVDSVIKILASSSHTMGPDAMYNRRYINTSTHKSQPRWAMFKHDLSAVRGRAFTGVDNESWSKYTQIVGKDTGSLSGAVFIL